MQKFNIYQFLQFVCVAASLLVSGCGDFNDENLAGGEAEHLTLQLSIAGASTRGEAQINGQGSENVFNSLDLFFYKEVGANSGNYGDDDTPAIFHHHAETYEETNKVELSLNGFEDLAQNRGSRYKVIAIANCAEADIDDLSHTSVNELKALKTRADAEYNASNGATRAFRYKAAPEDFVMTTFDDTNNIIKFDDNNYASGKLTFRRVAAKIRLALDVTEEIVENNEKWEPKTDEIRLFISNGVRTARLDGGDAELQDPFFAGSTDDEYKDDEYKAYLEASDYYSIMTSGSRQTQDFQYSREVVKSGAATDLTGRVDSDDYPYFNNIPYYTYPNSWTVSPVDPHQTKLTIVVPWHKADGDTDTYKPTYYVVPVVKTDESGVGNIVSNAYYYLRAYIGMMGSVTPETPVEIDVQSQIAEWGTADETGADIREIRFLEVNQKYYELNNTPSVDIPFNSTHDCSLKNVNITYYTYTAGTGVEAAAVNGGRNFSGGANATKISSEDNNYKFECVLDNLSKTIHFKQEFNPKNYSRYEVKITICHDDDPTNGEYEKIIEVTSYPAIYVTVENHDVRPNALDDNGGWILVNGYGSSSDNTGALGPVSNHSGDSHVMLTLTVTNLNEAEKIQWVIDDPRTNFINNELDDVSMQSDLGNHFTTWTNGNYGGPYNGLRYGGGSSGDRWDPWGKYDMMTIWEWYDDTWADWTIDYVDETGSTATWNAKDDKMRTLKYYYPASELPEKGNVIGPKITFVSGYAFSADKLEHDRARRRCATYQQYGYPAGRWRLPTIAEMQLLKRLAKTENKVKDVFGGSDNWSSQGVVNTNGVFTGDGTGYVRCVYDSWYWERYDKNGKTMNRIPEGSTTVRTERSSANVTPTKTATVNDNWKIFVWGDRPKENPQPESEIQTQSTRSASGRSPEVERFLNEWQGVHSH